MGNLIGFEFKKFFRKKKNIVIIILLFLFVLLFAFLNNSINDNKKETKMFLVEEDIRSLENALMQAESNYKSFKDDKPAVAKNFKETMKGYKNQIDILNQKKQGLVSGDLQKSLKSEIEYDELILDGKRNGTIIGGEDSNIIEDRLEVNKILLEKNIDPIDTETSIKSWNFMRLLGRNLLPLIMVILILLFTSDAVSSEIDEGTFKFTLLQPITRNKIILSKIISYSLISILVISLLFIAFFIGLGVIEGFGSPEYPTKYYNGSFTNYFGNEGAYEVEYINISQFVLYMIPLLILLILAIVAIAIFISTIIGNSLAAISISVIGYISLFILNSQLGIISKFAHFLPIAYTNIPLLLSGDSIIQYSNTNITYINGAIIFIATILIFNISSILIFRKKDIL